MHGMRKACHRELGGHATQRTGTRTTPPFFQTLCLFPTAHASQRAIPSTATYPLANTKCTCRLCFRCVDCYNCSNKATLVHMYTSPLTQVLHQFTPETVRKCVPAIARSRRPGGADCVDLVVLTSRGTRELRMRCTAGAADVQSILQRVAVDIVHPKVWAGRARCCELPALQPAKKAEHCCCTATLLCTQVHTCVGQCVF